MERKAGPVGGLRKLVDRGLNVITESMSPILGVIVGCGMVKLLNIILSLAGVPADNSTLQLLTILGDIGFYAMPILLAYTSARKFGCDPIMAMVLVALLLHPDLAALFEQERPVDFLGLPVTTATYSSTVLPALLITWAQSHVERWVERLTPGWSKELLKPMLILLIMLPLELVVLAPAGAIAGEGARTLFGWLQAKSAGLTLMLFAALIPFMVVTGMHFAFIATCLADIATQGYDTLFLTAMLAANLAQGAASLAVAVRCKNKKLKSIASAAALSALATGVTEPSLHGVTMKLRRPLIAVCVGSGLAGLYIGSVGLRSYSFVAPSLISVIQFIDPNDGMNFVHALIGGAITIGATFLLTLLLGWKEPEEE